MKDALAEAFDPEKFRAEGHALVDRIASYLQAAQRGELPVLPVVAPEEQVTRWPGVFPEEPRTPPGELLGRAIAGSIHLHAPGYVGHQVTAPLPVAALCELVSGLLNNGMAVYEMGPVATAMERAVIAWMAARLGLPAGGAGVLTSGGSAGNLTALLAARQAKAGHDVWDGGAGAGPPLTVLASEQAHYSVRRSAQILGLGAGGFTPVPVDAAFRLRPDALGPAYDAAVRVGRMPIAVVASACSTATGSFDPLEPIADFCAERGLWLHVDGAHGAAAILSPKHRSLLRGIERADSVIWDAHKMLLVPALSTAVLFREARRSAEAFAQEAGYLFEKRGGPSWDTGTRTLECTKRMLALPLYTCLHAYGTRMFEQYVERMFSLGARFAELLREAGDFEVPVEPACNIVCFRHVPRGARDLDGLQGFVRKKLLASGRFYLVQARLPAGVFLRVTLVNPLTTEAHLRELIEEIRAVAS